MMPVPRKIESTDSTMSKKNPTNLKSAHPAPKPPRPAAIPRSRLQRLAQAIANAGMSHADCEAALEFYLDGELRRQDARKLYPSVWQHLQTCARCRASYELLHATLVPVHSPAPNTLPALPFLAPAAANAAWRKRVRARVGGAALGFGFLIQPHHLRQLFNSAALPLTRGHPSAENRSLLLTDTINLGQREVAVEMWLQRSPDPSEGQLEISIAASAPLPEPLHAKLEWNGHTLSALVRQGSCLFEHLALAELQSARHLRVEFEAGTSLGAREGQDGDRFASA